MRSLFRPEVHLRYASLSNGYRLEVHHAAIFSDYLGLKEKRDTLPRGAQVCVNLNRATLVDLTVMEHVFTYKDKYLREGGRSEVTEMGHLVPRAQHPFAARRKPEHATTRD